MRQVFFNSNAQGLTLLSVAVYSLLKANRPSCPISVFVAHDSSFADAGCDERIRQIVGRFPFATVEFLDYTPCARKYGPVFAPVLWAFPLCDKLLPPSVTGNILYLDIDMLVRHDLGELFDLDLKRRGLMAAAVSESHRADRPDLVAAGWPESAGDTFNNATTVLDLDRFRAERASDRMIDWYRLNHKAVRCQDQDAQNVVYGAQTLRLPPKWNYTDGWLDRIPKMNPLAREWRVFSPHEMLEAIVDPCVIHYIGPRKPTSWTHRSERQAFRQALAELGLLEGGRLPGETLPRRIVGAAFDAYHAALKLYARLLLNTVCRRVS